MSVLSAANYYKMSFLVILFLGITTVSSAKPLSRFQRQSWNDGLTSGLTGTGTSFRSSKYHSEYPYQQETLDLNRGRYQGVPGNEYPDVHFEGGLYGGGAGNWKGFGMGKNPYGSYNPTQYGVKY